MIFDNNYFKNTVVVLNNQNNQTTKITIKQLKQPNLITNSTLDFFQVNPIETEI